ncbi:MAG TPA: hypothetical protein VMW94_10885 [Actinomycetes bacterium]|nr:hypothetical protein [Actinomycetes bacterium]
MSPGFMDKARAAAQQAMDEAKKGIDSGQAKLDEVQAKREMDKQLAALGAAFYLEQRQDGSRDDVNAALGAVDGLVQEHGMVGFPDPAEASPPDPAAAPAPAPTPAPPPPSVDPPPTSGGSPYDAPPA